jgi:hypothetical protein
MNSADPMKNRRIWRLKPFGTVRYKSRHPELKLNALRCLGRLSALDVSVSLPQTQVDAQPIGLLWLRYDVLRARWLRDDKRVVDVDTPEARPIVTKELDRAVRALNTQLAAPHRLHQNVDVAELSYASGWSYDAPIKTRTVTKQLWRLRHSEWLKTALKRPEFDNASPRDAFDRAFDLMARLDTPIPTVWMVVPPKEGIRHVALCISNDFNHVHLALMREKLTLVIDPEHSLLPEANRNAVVAAQVLALAQVLRLLAADRLGAVVISVYSTDSLDELVDFTPLMQVQIGAAGWLNALPEATVTPLSDLGNRQWSDLSVHFKYDQNWIRDPWWRGVSKDLE